MKNSRKNSQKKFSKSYGKIHENKADQKICEHCDLTEKQLFKTCTTFILT